MIGLAVYGSGLWLRAHPEYDPRAPLTIDQADTWVTRGKIAGIRDDRDVCRAFLRRSDMAATALEPAGIGECRREDRKRLAAPDRLDIALRPSGAQATCAVDAGLALWLHRVVQPAAEELLRARVENLEHLGTANCRRIGGSDTGNWSEHASGNAIDIAAFVLADGRRVSVLRDWSGGTAEANFLHTVRNGACASFSTVLSPDYNTAHADHLHLDQALRRLGWSACQ